MKKNNDIAFITKALGEYIDTLDGTEFEINQAQYDKFYKVVGFLANIAEKCNGKLEPIKLQPFTISGGASATFDIFSLWREDIKGFQSMLDDITALDIDIQNDKVCISVCVPDVFVEKK